MVLYYELVKSTGTGCKNPGKKNKTKSTIDMTLIHVAIARISTLTFVGSTRQSGLWPGQGPWSVPELPGTPLTRCVGGWKS